MLVTDDKRETSEIKEGNKIRADTFLLNNSRGQSGTYILPLLSLYESEETLPESKSWSLESHESKIFPLPSHSE